MTQDYRHLLTSQACCASSLKLSAQAKLSNRVSLTPIDSKMPRVTADNANDIYNSIRETMSWWKSHPAANCQGDTFTKATTLYYQAASYWTTVF